MLYPSFLSTPSSITSSPRAQTHLFPRPRTLLSRQLCAAARLLRLFFTASPGKSASRNIPRLSTIIAAFYQAQEHQNNCPHIFPPQRPEYFCCHLPGPNHAQRQTSGQSTMFPLPTLEENPPKLLKFYRSILEDSFFYGQSPRDPSSVIGTSAPTRASTPEPGYRQQDKPTRQGIKRNSGDGDDVAVEEEGEVQPPKKKMKIVLVNKNLPPRTRTKVHVPEQDLQFSYTNESEDGERICTTPPTRINNPPNYGLDPGFCHRHKYSNLDVPKQPSFEERDGKVSSTMGATYILRVAVNDNTEDAVEVGDVQLPARRRGAPVSA
ncbi:hypothetical protein B0H66DRAFT_632889 [Apodospora peruviana]|uniref:Uncharacterized protein n=1 Tax=Apodospora peruviana TaxID=516989 RepID=A0AAE0LYD7_9PEZI|nr:hypothetical protein B0H66DRAFT_632889 [Apodospora peruviana]